MGCGRSSDPALPEAPASLVSAVSEDSDLKFARRNILTNPHLGARDHISADVVTLGTFSEGFYNRLQITPELVWKDFESIISEIPPILNRNTAAASPSIFKRAAALTISFIQHSPLNQPFPKTSFPEVLTEITNHQNAIVAFEYCRQCLHEASYDLRQAGGTPKTITLKSRIALSDHFYYDLIHGISNIKSDTSFHFIALLYESLAYKANKGASYPEVV